MLTKTRPLYKKKKFIIPMTILALLVVARIVIPPIALKVINNKLAKDSPYFTGHIDDLDLSILRGSLGIQGITASIREGDKEILNLKSVESSIAWKKLLSGKITAEVLVDGMTFNFYQKLPSLAKKEMARLGLDKKDEKDKDKKSPLDLDKFIIRNSRVVMADLPSIKANKKVSIDNIDGTFRNLTPNEKNAVSFMNVKANVLGTTPVKTVGQMKLKKDPPQWDIDTEVQGFDLTQLNPLLKAKVPLTFTNGKLDVYAEAKSEKGVIQGYFKPFIKNLDVVRTEEDFKGPKHWAVEIITAMSNIVLKAENKEDSVATKVPFSYAGKVNVGTGEALENVIQHGFNQQLTPGIEDTLKLKE